MCMRVRVYCCREHNSLVEVNAKLSEAFQMYHSLMQGYASAARQPEQVYFYVTCQCDSAFCQISLVVVTFGYYAVLLAAIFE